jgi:ferredoxin
MSSDAYTIVHDRPECIGCTACAAVAPKFWTMNEDGKADLKGGERMNISEEDFDLNMDAAESCPVNVIHLIRIGDQKNLI